MVFIDREWVDLARPDSNVITRFDTIHRPFMFKFQFKGYDFGHLVEWIPHSNGGVFAVYCDTGEPVGEFPRPCLKCGRKQNPDGTDPCLGFLPGVEYACCGHGLPDIDPTLHLFTGAKIVGWPAIEEYKRWVEART